MLRRWLLFLCIVTTSLPLAKAAEFTLVQDGQATRGISVISFGAWPIAGGMGTVPEKQAIDTVHAALDCGMTSIDTAEGYGNSEEILGKALKGRREQVFICTKVSGGDNSVEHMNAAIEKSLRALPLPRKLFHKQRVAGIAFRRVRATFQPFGPGNIPIVKEKAPIHQSAPSALPPPFFVHWKHIAALPKMPCQSR